MKPFLNVHNLRNFNDIFFSNIQYNEVWWDFNELILLIKMSQKGKKGMYIKEEV